MYPSVHQTYMDNQIETAVASARPVDLVVMVYDRLFDHLKNAENALQSGRSVEPHISKALELTQVGLQSCIKPEVGEIARNLADLYGWANRQILLGKLNKDHLQWAQVRQVLTPLLEAWRQIAQDQSDAVVAQAQSSTIRSRASTSLLATG
jgi:flagellar secretion chaperone FliS